MKGILQNKERRFGKPRIKLLGSVKAEVAPENFQQRCKLEDQKGNNVSIKTKQKIKLHAIRENELHASCGFYRLDVSLSSS